MLVPVAHAFNLSVWEAETGENTIHSNHSQEVAWGDVVIVVRNTSSTQS